MSMELSETRRDLEIYLKRLGISIETIWVIRNLMLTDEETREIILSLLDIKLEMFLTDLQQVEDSILQKAIQIYLSR